MYSRNSSVTHAPIAADDHAAVQILVPKLNEDGVITKENTTFILKGAVRQQGVADHCLNREFQKAGLLETVVPKNMMI